MNPRLMFVLRHGHAGADGHLSPEGIAQVEALFKDPLDLPYMTASDRAEIWVSAEARSRETGEGLARKLPHWEPVVKPIHLLDPIKRDAKQGYPGAAEVWARVEAHRQAHQGTSVGAALAAVPGGLEYMRGKARAIVEAVRQSQAPAGVNIILVGHENVVAPLLWEATSSVAPELMEGPRAPRNVEGAVIGVWADALRLLSMIANPYYDQKQ